MSDLNPARLARLEQAFKDYQEAIAACTPEEYLEFLKKLGASEEQVGMLRRLADAQTTIARRED